MDGMLQQALAGATGRQESLIKKQYDESGDLGTVASAARATQRTMFTPSPLTIPGVLKSVLFIYSFVHQTIISQSLCPLCQ